MDLLCVNPNCENLAVYIFQGNSLCEEHYIEAQMRLVEYMKDPQGFMTKMMQEMQG